MKTNPASKSSCIHTVLSERCEDGLVIKSSGCTHLGGLRFCKQTQWRQLHYCTSGTHCKNSFQAYVCQCYCCNAWVIMKLFNCSLAKALVSSLRLKYKIGQLWNAFNHLAVFRCTIIPMLYQHVNLLSIEVNLQNWTRKCDFTLRR